MSQKIYVHYGEGDAGFTHKSVVDPSTPVAAVIVNFVNAYNKCHESVLYSQLLKLSFDGKTLSPKDFFETLKIPNGADIYATHDDGAELLCAHNGCGKKYFEKDNSDSSCSFHSGAPVFHEGNKGWQCCKPRVLEFEEFLAIPGCSSGRHVAKVIDIPEPIRKGKILSTPSSSSDVEVYASPAPSKPSAPPPAETAPAFPPDTPDPADAVIAVGASCLHRGCESTYTGPESREAPCRYHPGMPVFHEGSKGWQCCKGFTLVFEDFLSAPGCIVGKHKFVPEKETQRKSIRHDWYQLGDTVVVSFYEKGVSKTSTVEFQPTQFVVKLKLKDESEYEETIQLTNGVTPADCKFSVLSTKVEIKLKKADLGSEWTSL